MNGFANPSGLVAFAVILAVALLLAATLWRRRTGGAALKPKALLNRPEAKLFRMIEHRLPKGYRLHAQVSYGEIFAREETETWFRINARRADMVITDKAFNVITVIEYQGAGHAGFTARSAISARRRDALKRQTLNDAGLPLIEVPKDLSPATVEAALNVVFPEAPASPRQPPTIRRPE